MKKNVLFVGLALLATSFTANAEINIEDTYTDVLNVTLYPLAGGDPTSLPQTTENITLTKEAGLDTYSLSLLNFVVDDGESTIPVGDIEFGGMMAVEENGLVVLSRAGAAAGPLVYGVIPTSITLTEGNVSDGNLYLKLTVAVPGLMDVEVVFGTKPTVGVASVKANQLDITTTAASIEGLEAGAYTIYTLNGAAVKAGNVDAGAINISSLAKGTYVLNVNGKTVKFVK